MGCFEQSEIQRIKKTVCVPVKGDPEQAVLFHHSFEGGERMSFNFLIVCQMLCFHLTLLI